VGRTDSPSYFQLDPSTICSQTLPRRLKSLDESVINSSVVGREINSATCKSGVSNCASLQSKGQRHLAE
jgi:hypothetical protein